jgi:hypothetical protein
LHNNEDVDHRDKASGSDAVLRTAKPGGDDREYRTLCVHTAFSRKPPQSVKTRLAAIPALGESVFLNGRIES